MSPKKLSPISPIRKTRPSSSEAEAFERSGEVAARAVAGEGRALKSQPSTTSKARRGSSSQPYVRKDGTRTRAVGWHVSVDVAGRIRVAAAMRGVSQSTLVSEILEGWLHEQGE